MNIETLREHCISKHGVTEGFPFNETTLVFKVAGKMFCLTSLEGDFLVTMKNKPEKNIELREQFNAVKPGYHMNKKHWNTIDINGTISDEMIFQLIDDSYNLTVQSLPKKKQQGLK